MIKIYYILFSAIYTDAIYFNKMKSAILILNMIFLYKIYIYKIEDPHPSNNHISPIVINKFNNSIIFATFILTMFVFIIIYLWHNSKRFLKYNHIIEKSMDLSFATNEQISNNTAIILSYKDDTWRYFYNDNIDIVYAILYISACLLLIRSIIFCVNLYLKKRDDIKIKLFMRKNYLVTHLLKLKYFHDQKNMRAAFLKIKNKNPYIQFFNSSYISYNLDDIMSEIE